MCFVYIWKFNVCHAGDKLISRSSALDDLFLFGTTV